MIITANMRADMYARKLRGESVTAIALSYGLKPMTVYQSLRRKYGLDSSRPATPPQKSTPQKSATLGYVPPVYDAANDNHPGRTRRLSARNGGCSTVSGLMPVTLARVPTVDGPYEVAA